MDAFELVVSSALSGLGYWTRTSYKVPLRKNEKKKIGRPTTPRWEVDVIAYSPSKNEVLVVECKSFLDSTGVKCAHFVDSDKPTKSKYKLFNERKLRRVVSSAAMRRLKEQGLCKKDSKPKVRLCLVVGKFASSQDQAQLGKLFNRRGWKLFDRKWLKDHLGNLSKDSYENEVAAVVSKLLLRAI